MDAESATIALRTNTMPTPPKKGDAGHPLAPQNVLKVLLKRRLIDKDQAREIIKKHQSVQQRLSAHLRHQDQVTVAGIRYRTPITFIDVLMPHHLIRSGDRFLGLEEDKVYQALAEAWGIAYRKIDPLKLDLNLATTTIPRSFARKHLVLPLVQEGGELIVATIDPFNQEVLEDIARVTQHAVRPVVSTKSDIVTAIEEFFGFKRSIAEAEHHYATPAVDLGNLEQYVRLKSADELPSNDQHIINAVNHLFTYALDQRASDIHIEPKRQISLVRMRIDGILHDIYQLPKNVHPAIISRIKNLSRMDMAEKRRPQDGRIKTDKGDAEIEIRISSVPVAFGEKIVMRIMDPETLFQDLEHLGFETTDLLRYHRFVSQPHGIVLVCGPTGSGKSTTLYSTLREIASPEINVTTIEDPIEMVEERFNQIAVQPAVGITFATILRNILRQDPDVIMVGEMRDLETAENAIQAALTGHLVFSTLHTNDATSAINRLRDLGVPAFLIQNTLVGILSQRLVRKICPKCKEAFNMPAAELQALGLDIEGEAPVSLWRGRGCMQCRDTGYYGRTGIFEVLPYSTTLRGLTRTSTDIEAVRKVAVEEGLRTLRENAVTKLLKGVTTYHEVLRVT